MGSVSISDGLYLRVHECEKAPRPYPLQSGFTSNVAYRVLGVYNPSETSEAYFIMANDKNELWFISNRHMNFYSLMPNNQSSKISIIDQDEMQISLTKPY